ncbi:hypothetical protein DFH07DRAFT_786375 [Mycena maculata]|uniref:Uncharacterized protein n=1 Tax=Mycena maculata TaxID=230809 RepID=A0AAD7KK38_9AGAR|nr:hypothetical protein DFH07DRAFT_786375 [Mycena maculata]
MPVTFCPSTHPANSRDVDLVMPTQILRKACPNQFAQVDRILEYSVGGRSSGPGETPLKIVSNANGFVNTVMSAYSHHYALIIRPDDVWLAIVAQFSFYVNANAELLRANFVVHEGKRELNVLSGVPPDFAALSRQLADMIHQNVVDPVLREWILPKFSTTTMSDTTVGSMLIMATMKNYLDYRMTMLCGIPRVTLEGTQEDWKRILRRLKKLKEYGLQTIAWYHLLLPVISRFVQTFDNPDAPDNLEFWGQVACKEIEGSGSSYWSGWITAFCVFSTQGEWRGPKLDNERVQSRAPETMSSRRFWSSYTRPLQESRPHLTLDGTEYPIINANNVSVGYAEVDVKVDNNGTEMPCVIIVGLVGMGFSSSRDLTVSSTGKNDTVRPVVAWWMYSKLDEAERQRRREPEQHQQASYPPTIVTSPREPERSPRSERRRSTQPPSTIPSPSPAASTMRWVAEQSGEGVQGPPTTSGSIPARAKSEGSVPGENADPRPVRRRRNSFWALVQVLGRTHFQ